MTDADYEDALAFLTNRHSQTKPLLRSVEQAARGPVFYVNANKTDFTESGKALKLIDQFTSYLLNIRSTYTSGRHGLLLTGCQ